MFILGKFISNLVISPSLLIMVMLIGSIFLNHHNIRRYKKIFLVVGVVFYLLSIRPTKEIMIGFLEPERISTTAEIDAASAYVLLGGGMTEGTPIGDIPSNTAYSRIVETAILYKKSPKKIYITGGRVYDSKSASESSVYKGVLISLGVPEEDIIVEERSRTTYENAIYTKGLLEVDEIKSITLITSATHMYRARKVFEAQDLEVAIAPSGYLSDKGRYRLHDFFPSSSNLYFVLKAVWEYVGIGVYQGKIIKDRLK